LVISNADERGDFDVLKISSKFSGKPGMIEIENGSFEKGSLPLQSWIVVNDVAKTNTASVTEFCGQLKMSFVAPILKHRINQSTLTYARTFHTANRPGEDPQRPAFIPGETTVPYAGRVFTEEEVQAAVSSTLDFWLTLGPEGEAFEKELAAFLGVKHSLLVNSGSSANLVALSCLTTHKLPPHKRIQPGDEVITCAAGFPTTVAPIIQCGAVPVFIDNDPTTGNARADQLEQAFSPGKTKAVMMAHTLGNPFDLGTVLAFCRKHDLWLIEDNCDALGCTYSMPVETARSLGLDHLLKIAEAGTHPLIRFEELKTENRKLLAAPTGAWGELSTQSFYPPHHLTMGEGGAVNIVRHPPLKPYAESFRDWGRDCWCPSGKDNTCGKRFGWNLGELPPGYDHKYIYSHFGYNLKPLDPQAAIGRVQLKKLPAFIEARKKNWEYLRRGLDDLGEFFDFSLPTHATAWNKPSTLEYRLSAYEWDSTGCRTDCSWFGFMLRIKPGAPFTHTQFARHLDENKIGNRMLFGGNLLRQPLFVQLRKDRPEAFRTIGDHPGADSIMDTAIFLGTYPGLTAAMLDYEINIIRGFAKGKSSK
jgi:CDP-6-deoxy-D-xylo-4-hexulose-3-dehydrase